MIYPIKILQQKTIEHVQAIHELKNVDHEMQSSMLFCDEEIRNHEKCIKELNEAIEKLRK